MRDEGSCYERRSKKQRRAMETALRSPARMIFLLLQINEEDLVNGKLERIVSELSRSNQKIKTKK